MCHLYKKDLSVYRKKNPVNMMCRMQPKKSE